MRKRQKAMTGVLLLIVCLLANSSSIWAKEPYETYSYNFWGEAVVQPHAYQYSKTITVEQQGLSFPEDMCFDENYLYIADTGNSRILKLDLEGNIIFELTSAAETEDKLKEPRGVFVTDKGHIYVADSGNGRVVEYDEQGKFVRSIGRPDTNLIDAAKEYRPMKVVVDHAGRIYVSAYGINLGLVEFDYNGVFQGFMGAAKVSVSPFTYIWKNYFSTQEQQARMETIIPTEYSNIFVDDENFIYATINNLSADDLRSGADAIRRLNPTGTDVLRRLSNYDIIGDIGSRSQASSFCDVASTDYDCYFVLDSANGKVFAYDYDGNSLFVFGKKGLKEGNVQKPTAIALGEDESHIYVLDSVLGSILSYEITEYGRDLLDAIKLNSQGDSEGSYAKWQEVLKKNSNHELAYIGIGKTYLAEGDNKKAMAYFELGNSRKYYDKAFFYYRKEVMEENFANVMLLLGVVILVVFGIKGIIRFRRWVGEVRCYMAKQ